MATSIEQHLKEQENARKRFASYLDNIIDAGDYPKRLSLPISIQFELTEQCNMRCKHCYNQSGECSKNESYLNVEDWLNISHEIVDHGGVFQVILSGGEPLILKDDLFKIMDVFHNDGTKFILITNAYLLSKEYISRFKKYRFSWFQVSIDGTSAQVHDSFRQKNGSYDRCINACMDVSNAGIPLKIASTIIPSELDNIEQYVIQAISVGASAIILGDIMPSGRAFDNPELMLSYEQKTKLYNEIDRLRCEYSNYIEIHENTFASSQLRQMQDGTLDSLIIRPNGDLRLDCTAPFIVGNIKNSSFCKQWEKLPGDLWKHPSICKFIDSVDPYSGKSNLISNYFDKDIILEF